MALTPETQTAIVTQFQGSSQSQDSYNVDPGHGLYSQNNDFILGQSQNISGNQSVQVSTRRGTSQVIQVNNSDGAISSIASWTFSFFGSANCYVATYSTINGVRFYDQSNAIISGPIITVTGAAYAVFVFDGTRCYAAFTDATGRKGTSVGYVYGLFSNNNFGFPAVDPLFASPLPTTIAALAITQPTTGVITAGIHRLGYIFTTRNGFGTTGPLNPVTSLGVFAPVSFNAADGVHNLQVVITWASIPAYLNPDFAPFGATVQIVMTSAANVNEYYLVPGAIGGVPMSPGTTTITMSITDGDLVTGTNATLYQNTLTAINNAGPFNPSAIFTYSSRMAYVTIDGSGFNVVYFSDQNAYQSLSAATSGIYLEGRQIPVHGCSLGGLCYIATLEALYATQDNGGTPVTWTPPARVDGSVGILSPSCLIARGGKILLASEKGLYIYRGGTFPQIPISYWQSADWNRINWAAPTQVQIADDAFDHVIRVLAPLKVVISNASNTNPIVITTASLVNNTMVAYPHLFQTGLSVTITGVGGNTNANRTAVITVTGPNTFTIPAAGNGAYTSGGIATPNSPNATMSWAYPNGDSPGQTYYSIHAFTSYYPGAMGIVQNIATDEYETWWAPGTSNPGNLIRRVLPTDTNVYRDVDFSGNPSAISCPYETSLLPGSQDESMTLHDYSGAHMRVSGVGQLGITIYDLDHVNQVIPLASPITLRQTPGFEYLIKWYLRGEAETITLSTNAVDAYFVAALMRVYYTNSLPIR